MNKIILIGVNYNSSSTLSDFLDQWSKVREIERIYIIDNYSNDMERETIAKLCIQFNSQLICRDNDGYGAALNHGLQIVSETTDKKEEIVLLFGNIDVMPVHINLSGITNKYVPVIEIEQDGETINPFLNSWQERFLFLPSLAAKFESKLLLYAWLIVQKVIGYFPGKICAVHGAMFCLTKRQAELMLPIFDENVFLYCEELFFSRRIREIGFTFRKCQIRVKHIGSVSTSKTILRDKNKFFKNWVSSMRKYCK